MSPFPVTASSIRRIRLRLWETEPAPSFCNAARPVGSAIFGHFADKIGRRRLLVITIGGIGVMSLLGGLLPTYSQIGVWSYVMFCVLRFMMGCFFGGEYAIGHTFAIEHAPANKRGMIGGFIQSGFPLGYVFASLVFAAISAMLTKAAMAQFGWRIAFITGVMPVLLAMYIRTRLHESPSFEKHTAQGPMATTPVLSLLNPPHL